MQRTASVMLELVTDGRYVDKNALYARYEAHFSRRHAHRDVNAALDEVVSCSVSLFLTFFDRCGAAFVVVFFVVACCCCCCFCCRMVLIPTMRDNRE